MAIQLLIDLTVVLGVAVLAVYIFARLRLPPLVGLVAAGILIGPDGLGLIGESKEIEAMAEIGVVLLLFTIGLEFSISELLRMKDVVFLGGLLQMALTAAAGTGVSMVLGLPFNQALFSGLVMALSSTAISLRTMQQRAEVDAPHGRNAVGILIFQDLMVVPITMLVPLLVGSSLQGSPAVVVLQALAVVVGAVVAARWVVPWVLKEVARLQSPEVFLIAVLVICFAIAAASGKIGLSVALGAFVAGLIVSESEYSHQALGNVLPFRDVLVSFFFVSIGLLLDLDFLLDHWWLLLLAAIVVMAGKAVLATASVLVLRFPLRTALLAGLVLAQVGEFSFVLLGVGTERGLVSETVRQGFLALAVLTMIGTPIVIAHKERVADRVIRLPFPGRLLKGSRPEMEKKPESLQDHLVIIGFGVNGRNLARAARRARVTYVTVELNPQTVRQARKQGEPIVFGDATNEVVLNEVGMPFARVAAVVTNDPIATRRIVTLTRRISPTVHLIARTRYISEVQTLLDLGADEVVPEEFETAVQMFSRTLQQYLVPEEVIAHLAAEIRADTYGLLRRPLEEAQTWRKVESALPGLEITTLRVAPNVPAQGRTLAELDLRRNYGITLLAIKRGGDLTTNPSGNMKILAGDLVVLLGSPQDTVRARELFAICGEGAVC